MKFRKIEIEGFLSYYKRTEIVFSEGNTLIIGKNNTGKSKLFDAFHWALFNRVFDSQIQKWIKSSSELDSIVLNNRLKKEAIANRDTATAKVTIVLEAEDYENQIVTIARTNKYDFSASANPSISSSLAFYAEDAVTGDDSRIYTGADAENQIMALFPLCLRDFVVFQGEIASELMKLASKNQNTIKNAIEEVSRISLFQRAAEIAESYHSCIERKLNKAAKLSKENKARLDSLEKERTSKENEVRKLKEDKDSIEDTVSGLSETYDSLQSQLSQYQEVEEMFKNKEKYKLEYERYKNELEKYKEVHKEIASTWIFYKVRDKLASFSAFYKSLESLKLAPPPIPQTEIRASLMDHTCALCGNHLDEDSECYRNVKAKENNEMIDSMGKAIGKISYAIGLRMSEIENVRQAIERYVCDVEKQKKAMAAASQKFKDADGKLKSVLTSASDHTAKEDFETKWKLLAANESELEAKRTEKNKLEWRIEQLNEEIAKAKSEMARIRSLSEEINEDDRTKLSYASKLASCMTKLRASMQDVAYEEIQKEANNYYHKMAKENPAIIGDIRIDRKNSEIYTVNKQGEKILNINAGSRILIELAVIAGILSIASRRFGMTYPFVTDAPTSHLDGPNKIQTIMCMFQVFDQSLVIIKDDSEKGNEASDSLRKLISESKDIGAAYELEMVVDSEEIEDQYTDVHVLKGVQ